MSVQTRAVTIEPLNLSVTLIRARCRGVAPEQTNIGSATGFFYRKGPRIYLMTNKHVVFDSKKGLYPDNLQIRVHTSQTSSILNREIVIALYDNNQRLWLEHSSPQIDIVAVPIDSYIQTGDVIHCFSSADLPPPNIFLDVQDNCMVIGYPMGFHDTVHNFPIKRVGTIASPYGAHFSFDGTSNPLFLLDATLHPGTSGSPVILPPTTTRRIVDGAIIRQTAGNFPYQLLGVNSGAYEPLNLNMVWYAELIQEILPPTPAPPTPQPSP